MANFGPKPWTNPFGKISIFPVFELLDFFQPRKVFFLFQNIVKHISWPILPKRKRWKKRPILDQNHGLTPFEKSQFFDFLHFLFLQPRKTFFGFQNIVEHNGPGVLVRFKSVDTKYFPPPLSAWVSVVVQREGRERKGYERSGFEVRFFP